VVANLSRRLRDLEARLEAVLFERTDGGTHPTAAGRTFLETARHIIDETDAAFARHVLDAEVKADGSSSASMRLWRPETCVQRSANTTADFQMWMFRRSMVGTTLCSAA